MERLRAGAMPDSGVSVGFTDCAFESGAQAMRQLAASRRRCTYLRIDGIGRATASFHLRAIDAAASA